MSHELFTRRASDYIRWYPKQLVLPDQRCVDRLRNGCPEGIYIHVPFCERLCNFCPFNKRRTDSASVQRYVTSLCSEIETYSQAISQSRIDFVYFGGGTPSVLTPSQINQVLTVIDGCFGIANTAEITLEAHPTHLNRNFAMDLRDAGINRISTGIQSFDDGILGVIGAQHTAQDSLAAISETSKVFDNFGIDLLFGCPAQTVSQWEDTLRIALQFDSIAHFSCYRLVGKDPTEEVAPREEAIMTEVCHDILGAAGYAHYASCASGGFDFARCDYECRYEVRHWQAPQSEFLGLGPGAFGYVGQNVTANGLGIDAYSDRLEGGRLPLISLNPVNYEEQRRRYFVLGVKTMKVPLSAYATKFREPAKGPRKNKFTSVRITIPITLRIVLI